MDLKQNNAQKFKEYVNLLKHYSKGYRAILILTFLFIFTVSFINISHQWVFGILLDDIVYYKDIRHFYKILFGYFLIFCTGQFIHQGINYFWTRLMTDFLLKIRTDMISRILCSKIEDISKFSSGDLLIRINEDCKKIVILLFHNIFYSMGNITKLITALCIVFYNHFFIGFVLVIMILVYVVFNTKIKNEIKKAESLSVNERAKYSAFVAEMVNCIQDVKVFHAGEFIIKKLDEKNKSSNLKKFQVRKKEYNQLILGNGIIAIAHVILYVLAYYYSINNKFTVGNFLTTIMYYKTCTSLTQALYEKRMEISNNLISINRVIEILELPEEIGGNLLLDNIYSLEFRNVNFSYRNNMLFKNCSFKLEKGDFFALLGDNGEGKSTLCRLCIGLYHTNGGQILVNDKDIKNYDIKLLREKIGVIWQRGFFVQDSLRNNLLLGSNDIGDNEIWKILNYLGLNKIINQNEEGIDTILSHASLSGGELQKMNIARVLLHKPDILIIDEATSALDLFNEEIIKQIILAEYQEKIVIIISHRPNIFNICNKRGILRHGILSQL